MLFSQIGDAGNTPGIQSYRTALLSTGTEIQANSTPHATELVHSPRLLEAC
jgi:hypothetical protein